MEIWAGPIFFGKFAKGHLYFLAFAKTHCSIVILPSTITILCHICRTHRTAQKRKVSPMTGFEQLFHFRSYGVFWQSHN
jgi:hypothetical protein